MKALKIKTISTLSIASLALLLSACGGPGNTSTVNSSTVNTVKSNTNATANANKAGESNTSANANAASSPAAKSESDTVSGELQVGKTESVILYVGKETGDYAGYCFTNDSEAGRAILAACKNKGQCEVVGTVDHNSECKVPGLEANLSDSGKIVKVESAKAGGSK